MATVRITHELDYPAIYALMSNPRGGMARDMYRRGQNVRSRALRLAGVDTGRLRTSITVEMTHEGASSGCGSGPPSSTRCGTTRATGRPAAS
jgi:hypothetical protein